MNRFDHVSRRALIAGLGSVLLAPRIAMAKPVAASPAWPDVPPPRAPRISHPIVQLGRHRDDPYAWMKFLPETGSRTQANLPPELGRHLPAEAAYAKAMLDPLMPARDDLLAAMLQRVSQGLSAPPLTMGTWRYASHVPPGSVHAVHVRTGADGVERMLVDEADRARGHAYYRSTDHQPSPDHRYFAWAEDIIGNDRHRICVLDTRTGQIVTPVESDAYGLGGLVFSPSSAHLFWIWRDAHNRPTRLYRTALATGKTASVYEESDPAMFMQVARTAADGFIALEIAGPDMSEVRLIAASDETAAPRTVFPRRRGTTYQIEEWEGRLLLLTDADNAFDRTLLSLDPVSFAIRETLVPHRPGVPILALLPFKGTLARLERHDGLHRIVLRQADGREALVGFDDAAYALEIPARQDYHAPLLRIVHESPASPRRWIDVDLRSGARTTVRQEQLRDFVPADYQVERIAAPAPDGEMVPITILSRRGMPRNGQAPLLLYGYGAYGVSSDPVFSLPATVLVDRGWRYAIAHVRGGSEKGRRWFLDGRRFSKRNSMTDFVACAQHLCSKGYAAPKRVVSYGLSAGGLLVGGAMNIAPELWAGVIAKVPFVDMLNTMSDANHPLVPLFRPDWGDPLADPQAYDYIASISPYENVGRRPYPPLLCTAGLKDDRVPYWEPAKLVAQVRERSTSGKPAILSLDWNAGHQSSGDQRSEYAEMALFWAFAQKCAETR